MQSQPRYRHVIWDWNGTLLDDTLLCVEVLNALLAKRDRPPICIDTYRDNFNFPVIQFYDFLGFAVHGDSFDKISREFISGYEKRWLSCSLHADTERVLAQLAEYGVTHTMLSAAKQEALDFGTAHFGIAAHFERLVGQDNIHALGKVDKGRQLIHELQWNPGDVLLIGDTLHDHEVAQAMGVDCLLVAHGHHPHERLSTAGVPVISSLEEVLDHIIAPYRANA